MGCILYELATGKRPFNDDWAVLEYRFSRKNMEVVLDNSFDTHSVETITKYIVDMLHIDPSDRPSARILSKEFDRQLQLAHNNVLPSTVTDSVTLVAKSKSRQDDEDELLESQKLAQLEIADEYPAKVSSTKLFP